MDRFQLKPHYRIEVMDAKTLYLISEVQTHVLTGRLYVDILPLLDGSRHAAQIADQLPQDVDAELVQQVLERLYAGGYLLPAAPHVADAKQRRWSALGFDPAQVAQALNTTRIAVIPLNQISAAPFLTALAAEGLTAIHLTPAQFQDTEADLALLLCDDHLRKSLRDINHSALQRRIPWLPVRPLGVTPLIGPLFVPGKTGCHQCLAPRLRANRQVEQTIARQRAAAHADVDFPAAVHVDADHHAALIAHLTAAEVAKWIALQTQPKAAVATVEGRMLSYDSAQTRIQHHAAPHAPQCPACGDPEHNRQRAEAPPILEPRLKRFTSDGGHRDRRPEETLARFQHLIDPLTGVVRALHPVPTGDPNNHTWLALHSTGRHHSLAGLRHGLKHQSGGKGRTQAQAKTGALCEGVERYSSLFHGDEHRITAPFHQLDGAVHPRDLLHYSDRQYAQRQTLNQNLTSPAQYIPAAFNQNRAIEWTRAWSLPECHPAWIPTAYCYLAYDHPDPDHRFCYADTNGNAAGNTLEEAAFQGFLELVERDAVAIWWYNGLQRPAVDPKSFADPWLDTTIAGYQDRGRDLVLLDLSTDMEVPVIAAVSTTLSARDQALIGYGAHPDPLIAASRAVTEVNQLSHALGTMIAKRPAEAQRLAHINAANAPHIRPDPNQSPKTWRVDQPQFSEDLTQDLKILAGRAKALGMSTYLVDLTRPDVGLPVVKMVVPGLRGIYDQLGPGRLYAVPVNLGLLTTPKAEVDLTPFPPPL